MARAIHLVTFGCQMNKLDSELVAGALATAGHRMVASAEEADTVLFNTCSVRNQAENRVLSHIGQLKERKRKESGLLIGVLGCMAQRLGADLLRQAPGTDLVVGTRQFPHIAELLAQAESGPVVATDEVPLATEGALPQHRHRGGPNAWVAVMRGCNNFCAYCIVPHVRGREESRPLEAVVDEVGALVAAGAVEITLLGQSIDKYGQDLTPRRSLTDLLVAVDAVPGLARLRFVTAHPRAVTAELFETMAALPSVCEHLHMPAQSGSDAILQAMNRGYTRAAYEATLAAGHARIPDLAVASDFIVGFPGENEQDFAETLDLVQTARFQTLFAFRYSPRPGTQAATRPDNVPREAKEERLQALLQAQEGISQERNQALIGTRTTVLVEGLSKRDSANLAGRNRQNALVMIPAPPDPAAQQALVGREVEVVLSQATPLTLFGTLVE